MAHKGQGVLLVYTDLMDPKYEEEFNAWYNTEHLPELLALLGVLDAARYVATKGGPKYLAAYELASVDADARLSRLAELPACLDSLPRISPSTIGR